LVYLSPCGPVRRRRTKETPLARRLEHDDYLEKKKKKTEEYNADESVVDDQIDLARHVLVFLASYSK
jgi:hypothetical protein